jgi:hypothetical protein
MVVVVLDLLIVDAPMDGANIATAIHRLGKFRKQSGMKDVRGLQDAVRQLLEKAVATGMRIGPQAISNIFHGIASGRLDEVVSKDLCGRVLNDLVARSVFANFDAQGLANSMWSFATLGIRNDTLLIGVARECISRRFAQFNSQGVANVLWSFAKLGVLDVALFEYGANWNV